MLLTNWLTMKVDYSRISEEDIELAKEASKPVLEKTGFDTESLFSVGAMAAPFLFDAFGGGRSAQAFGDMLGDTWFMSGSAERRTDNPGGMRLNKDLGSIG